jgi:hypothetical protein
MRIGQFQVALLSYFSLVEAAATSYRTLNKVKIAKRQHHEPIKMPAWNSANSTTPDATPDGKKGVIIEPDLKEGKPGKDGGIVKNVRLGPYPLKAGQTKHGVVPNFAVPCTNCYITAMQLTCEYADGKEANVDSGTW